ncbi:Cationic peroxidase 1, partial [Linum perenne]
LQGCDGSVLLDDVAPSFIGEKTAPPNDNSLRGYEVIDKIKAAVESLCPGVVSCADILTVAARDAVVALGGPSWQVLLGRKDSTTASFSDALENLPSPFIDFNDLAAAFAQKGFSSREMITLSGAHTVGKARCATYRQRAHGDSNIDSGYAAFLKSVCPPSSGGDDSLAPLDNSTTKDVSPARFDVSYFKNLAAKKGLLHSDQAILAAGPTGDLVNAYGEDGRKFWIDFGRSMVKMGNIKVLTGKRGQIRVNCRRVN